MFSTRHWNSNTKIFKSKEIVEDIYNAKYVQFSKRTLNLNKNNFKQKMFHFD